MGKASLRLDYPLSRLDDTVPRPYVMLHIANGHDPSYEGVWPAIIDSGADQTCFPRTVADGIGHDFHAGVDCPIAGIGGVESFKLHSVQISLLAPMAPLQKPELISHFQIALPVEIVAAVCPSPNLMCILLGCHDFLRMWDFDLRVAKGQFRLTPSSTEMAANLRAWQKAFPF